MSAPRFVVVATWELSGNTDAAEVRTALASIGITADVQVLRFEGERLIATFAPTIRQRADEIFAQLSAIVNQAAERFDARSIERASVAARREIADRADARIENAIRELGHEGDPSPSWQERVHATLDVREAQLTAAARETLLQMQGEGKVTATVRDFRRWADRISACLSEPDAKREAVEIDQPTAAHKVARQVRIRALGVSIVFPPAPEILR